MNSTPTVQCKLIGIYGRARSGKDTVGKYLHDTRDNTYKLAFADPLKQAASKLFGIPEDNFYDNDLKEEQDQFWGVSPRQVAQFFGTEMVRQTMNRLIPGIEENFWVTRMIHTLTGQGDSPVYDTDDIVVISDVRFQNEYDWIVSEGGIIIHLTRPGAEGTVGIPGHPSEAGLEFTAPDHTYLIVNNGTLEELYEEVERVVTKANIYPLSNPDAF